MTDASKSESTWAAAIETAVDAAAGSVVRVSGGRRWPGSGFAWGDGLVLTTRRAVRRADDVRLGLPDGNEAAARVIGRDRGTDVAVLRTDAALPELARRSLDGIRVGHPTVALGRPGSAIRASLRIIGVLGPESWTSGGGRLDRWVETDRALPAGFSGGPLVDADPAHAGALIGLNTRALVRDADLAVPVATLERVVAEIVAHGGVRRGWLGVGVYPVELPSAAHAVAGRERGSMVVALDDDGPSAKAGLLLGDVLLDVDGEATAHPRALAHALHGRPDRDVVARVLRAGKVEQITVHTGVAPH